MSLSEDNFNYLFLEYEFMWKHVEGFVSFIELNNNELLTLIGTSSKTIIMEFNCNTKIKTIINTI